MNNILHLKDGGKYTMYAIVVYDMETGRTDRPRKICKRYLHHVQGSVFEGQIKQASIHTLESKLQSILKPDESIIIYKLQSDNMMNRITLGTDPIEEEQFI